MFVKKEFSNRLKLLQEHITEKIKEDKGNRIKRIAESISNNIVNGRKIWEVKWKVKRKHETTHFIINSEERKIENKEELLKECQKYYESLLPIRLRQNLQEDMIEQEINRKFQKIIDHEPKVD